MELTENSKKTEKTKIIEKSEKSEKKESRPPVRQRTSVKLVHANTINMDSHKQIKEASNPSIKDP